MKRIGLLLLLMVCVVPLAAQTRNDIGISLLNVALTNTSLGFEPADRAGEFDEGSGFGLTFNHYWSDVFSTELSVQHFRADAVLGAYGIEGGEFFDRGEVDATIVAVLAEWHFRRQERVSPYVGVGLAHIAADFDSGNDVTIYGDFDFQNAGAVAAVGGLDVNITEQVAFNAELRVMPWTAEPENEPGMRGVDADPFISSVGLKFRF